MQGAELSNKIFYMMRQGKVGPYSKDEIIEMWYKGIVQDQDVIFNGVSNTYKKFREAKEFQCVYPKLPRNYKMTFDQQVSILRTASEINCAEAREKSTINISEFKEKHIQNIEIINLKHRNNIETKNITHKHKIEIIKLKNHQSIKNHNLNDNGIVGFIMVMFFFFFMMFIGVMNEAGKYAYMIHSQNAAVLLFLFIPMIFICLIAGLASNQNSK